MIGALLMTMGLAIIFLTRPDRKRGEYIRKWILKTREFLSKNSFNRNKELSKSAAIMKSGSDFIRTSPRSDDMVKSSWAQEISDTINLQSNQAQEQIESVLIKPQEIIDEGESHIKNSTIAALINSLTAYQDKIKHVDKIPPQTFEAEDELVTKTESPNDLLNKEYEEIINMLANSAIQVGTENSAPDDTIIDIDTTYQPIDYSTISSIDSEIVPNWPHNYIYSYNDIERASDEQRAFYERLKAKFLAGKWVDLAGNTNYAFILLFDLLRQFNVHNDIKLLEEQVNSISNYYPKTASYAKRFLIEKMHEIGDQEGLNRLEWTVVNHNRTDYQSWDWKNRYIKKLNLGKADAQLLDDVYTYSTNFMNIEFCAIEVVKLFISARKTLQNAYKVKDLHQNTQFAVVLDLVARKQYNYRYNSQNYQYVLANNNSLVLNFILKYCENKVRELFRYNRKSTFFQGYHPDVISAFNSHIFSYIDDQLDLLLNQLARPDDATEIELNSIVNTRWKLDFNLSESQYRQVGKEAFLSTVNEIIRLNAKNSSLELIYLEIAKILISCDKQLSFEYFLRYISQNLISGRLVLKSMSQTMVKKLFQTPDLQIRYHSINTALIKKELKIEEALEEIKDFYLPVRKKIILNTRTIKLVEEQHSDTVELLSEYLKDEDTVKASPILLNPVQTDLADIIPPKILDNNFYKFKVTPQEDALITLFKNNDFKLSSYQIDSFCKNTGSMKGTLINNLNESCYELIDDLLIEQESDEYRLNKTYYDQIINI